MNSAPLPSLVPSTWRHFTPPGTHRQCICSHRERPLTRENRELERERGAERKSWFSSTPLHRRWLRPGRPRQGARVRPQLRGDLERVGGEGGGALGQEDALDRERGAGEADGDAVDGHRPAGLWVAG